MELVKDLKPLSSFTDTEGILQSGNGRPCIETTWGVPGKGDVEERQVVKCEMNKESRHEMEWQIEYFEWVKPALKEGVINTMNIEPNVKANEEQESAAAESAAQDQATGADQGNAEEGGTEG